MNTSLKLPETKILQKSMGLVFLQDDDNARWHASYVGHMYFDPLDKQDREEFIATIQLNFEQLVTRVIHFSRTMVVKTAEILKLHQDFEENLYEYVEGCMDKIIEELLIINRVSFVINVKPDRGYLIETLVTGSARYADNIPRFKYIDTKELYSV